MPFVLDSNGNIVTQDVNGQKLPVFKGADGKEAPFDGDGTVATIGRLNGEARGQRERAEAAEGKLKPFTDAGLTDPAAAAKALNTVANLDAKQLVDAGEAEKVRTAAIDSVRKEFEPVVKERDTLKTQLENEIVGGAFARSTFIAGKDAKVVVPPDMMQAMFGRHFTVEGGKLSAKDANGAQIFSRTRHGEPATFDEAIEIVVDSYPGKASILKGSNAAGSGAQGGGGTGGGAGGKKQMTRTQFDALDPVARATEVRSGTAIVDG